MNVNITKEKIQLAKNNNNVCVMYETKKRRLLLLLFLFLRLEKEMHTYSRPSSPALSKSRTYNNRTIYPSVIELMIKHFH